MDTRFTNTPNSAPSDGDRALMKQLVAIVHDAGERLLAVYSADARPRNRDDIFAAGQRIEAASMPGLRSALGNLRPQAGWVEEEQETTALPPGEWWVVDAAEGGVNHVHGLPEWCVTTTLMRDGVPTITAVYQPLGNLTYMALRGGGAYLNGQRLRASAKTDLSMAIVTTGQAEAGQEQTYRRIGDSITAMLNHALLVRATVPSTFPMLLVAGGHYDVFWQYEPVLPGIAPGILLITEAGGVVSDIHGQPWRPGSPDVLVAAPGLHGAAIAALSTVA